MSSLHTFFLLCLLGPNSDLLQTFVKEQAIRKEAQGLAAKNLKETT